MDETASEALYQHWVRSNEEDTSDQKVYRPATYSFPRSRGRFSFELKRDGTAVFHGTGPTDQRQSSTGTWRRTGDQLALYSDPTAHPDQVLEIVSVSTDRLVVRR